MYLDRIVAEKPRDPAFMAGLDHNWDDLLGQISPEPKRSLKAYLRSSQSGQEPAIIAEMKRSSPSKGSFGFVGSVSHQVRQYEQGGAKAVSVLTNGPFFGGTLADLKEARTACNLPILRKDFLTELWEVPQAKYHGADAVLLIAAILTDHRLETMTKKAHECDLEVLLEIHDQTELERVLHLGTAPDAVGINNRNLQSFVVDLEVTARLAPALPKEICRVSESGFATRSDLERFKGVVDAFLIGETLMKSENPEHTLRGWVKG